MYQITYFGHESGDMESVNVAITFESAVADVLIHLGRSKNYHVQASVTGETCRLLILKYEVVVATVEACDVVSFTGSNNPVHDACAALQSGDANPLVQLFAAA